MRIALLTGVALALFSVIFLRLWYLQVLSGDSYREQANDNRVREIRVQPPRGDILDRNGKVLVRNRTEMALQVQPNELPAQAGRAQAGDHGGLRGDRDETGQDQRGARAGGRGLPRRPGDAADGARAGQGLLPARAPGELSRRRRRPPSTRRDYKQGTLAAHLFGNVGEVTAEQLQLPRYQGLEQGDLVGQSGIEYEYDRFLRGRPGATRIQVNSRGIPRGQLTSVPARAGENVRLTIDSDLQATGEAALGSFGLPGAFVALEPERRRGPGDGLGADLRSGLLHRDPHPAGVRRARPRRRTTPSSTGRSAAAIRPGRPSSRSRPPPRSRTG